MAAPQTEIYLFNLPVKALKKIVDEAQLSAPRQPSKLDLVKLITGQLTDRQIEDLAGSMLYAGSTSITWIQFVTEDEPHEPISVDVAALKEALAKEVGKDPFTENVRPGEVTGSPKLMDAREMEDGTIVLTFVVRKPVRVVFQNFEPVAIHEDDYFLTVIRPDLGLAEVRSAHHRAEQLMRGFLRATASRMDAELALVPINSAHLAKLKASLNAKLHRYRGKHAKGSAIDMHDMSKAEDCDDLDTEQEFSNFAKDTMPMQVDWVFSYNGTTDVRVQVSARYGSIWFRTPVSEEIIEHVFEKLRAVQKADQ
jgi:hypothetical protein